MDQNKKAFVCSSCNHVSSKWYGQCPNCKEWNTFPDEAVLVPSTTTNVTSFSKESLQKRPILLTKISSTKQEKVETADNEFNRVLGGGLVPGSISLISGAPGVGKSTLMLQLAMHMQSKVMFVSGEESQEQIRMRADRLGKIRKNCYIFSNSEIQSVIRSASDLSPSVIMIDSIQSMKDKDIEASSGSAEQSRECALALQQFAKASGIPVLLVGHISNDLSFANPKHLEHIVDAAFVFEGENNSRFRFLRSVKNRFGSTEEMGIYEMRNSGLHTMKNPSAMLLQKGDWNLTGCAIAASSEHNRTMFVETQALVSTPVLDHPQRSAIGFDPGRLNMLLAVLEKRSGFQFQNMDVFLNIAGGFRINDPGMDLAVCTALVSSLYELQMDNEVVFCGEVGLSGEIRGISDVIPRLMEADRLGFTNFYCAPLEEDFDTESLNIKVHEIKLLKDLFEPLFENNNY